MSKDLYKTLPVLFFMLAILTAIVQRLKKLVIKESVHIVDISSLDTIYVCLISSNDPELIQFIKYIRARSEYPNRIRIGVLEYVDRHDLSVADSVPENIRPFVQFYTKSTRSIGSVVNAQRICIEQFYKQEKYICLMCACLLEMGWDSRLCHNILNEKTIISIPLSKSRESRFITCRIQDNRVVMKHETIKQFPVKSIPSIMCDHSFLFGNGICIRKLVEGVYRVKNHQNISAAFTLQARELHFYLMSPTHLIASKGYHPLFKQSKSKRNYEEDESIHERLIELLKLRTRPESVYARVGLTLHPSDEECIAKYGSVAASRIAIEQKR